MTGGAAPRILLIRLRSLGDLVLITPCTRAVKESHPDSTLAVAVDEGSEVIFEGNPYVDEVLSSPVGNSWIRELAFLRRLRRERFDWVFNLHGGPRSALMTLASGAAQRVGGLQKANTWNRVYNVRVPPFSEILGSPGPFHIVERHLATLSCGGIRGTPGDLVVPVQPGPRKSVRQRLHERGIGKEEPVVVFHPIPAGGTNRWGVKNFAALADALASGQKARPVFIGSPGDRVEVEEILKLMKTAGENWCGETTLGELAALLELSQLFVGVDSGPSHLAAGVGAPVVVLWGAATLTTWHPWTSKLTVVGGSGGGYQTRREIRHVAAGKKISEIGVDDVLAAMELHGNARIQTH